MDQLLRRGEKTFEVCVSPRGRSVRVSAVNFGVFPHMLTLIILMIMAGCVGRCIPGCRWQWPPAALWLLLYVPFKASFQRGAGWENSLCSDDSLISCFLAFVVFTTEMCVQILIKGWFSFILSSSSDSPLRLTASKNQAIYFPLPSFSFPAKINAKIFFFSSLHPLLQKPVDFCLNVRSGL